MPISESPGQTSNDKTTDWPGVVHAHTKIDLPFSWRRKIPLYHFVALSKLTSANLHGPYEGCSVAGDGHGASDPPREDETPVERHERGDHSKHTHCHLMMNNILKSCNWAFSSEWLLLTEAPQIAVFLPNRSETSPEQKEPRAKPGGNIFSEIKSACPTGISWLKGPKGCNTCSHTIGFSDTKLGSQECKDKWKMVRRRCKIRITI